MTLRGAPAMTGAMPTTAGDAPGGSAQTAPGVVSALAATMLAQAMVAMAVSAVPVLAPALAETYGVRAGAVGFYSSLAFAGAIVCVLFGGALARRFGALRCSQAALCAAGAALALSAAAPLAGIAALAVATGMGYGLATPAASHILARVAPAHRRGVVLSLKQSAVPLGGLLAGLAAPALAAAFGWRGALVCIAGALPAAAVCIAPLRARLDDDRAPDFPLSARTPLRAVAYALGHPGLRRLTVAAFSFAAVQSSVFAVSVAWLVEAGELTLARAGLVFAVMQAAGATARVACGWLSDRTGGALLMLRFFAFGMALVLLAAAGLDSSWPFAAMAGFAALAGLVVAGWPGVYLAEILRAVPADRVGVATGGTVGFSFLGVVAGPAAFSALVAAGGWPLAFVSFAVFAALAGAMLRPGR